MRSQCHYTGDTADKRRGTRSAATKEFLFVIKRLGTQQANIIIIIKIIIILYEKLCLTVDTVAIF
jgi:hypothetical protein